ncbi:alpha/beta hydrolase [Dactylosporangium matsuzakiense]|uniref:Alpha/beta hydrolase n=1 Tax=Dactylosporangium matsuzakiense TaxID=53360 RepID=A0A9W6KX19_9ACTN|nr:lysophospholipase [Dactylosporangium matsuzakiense]UWZ47843.1 alpha/beta fold hydrolase [Dactylosporangium matsuzakiense]GLL08775.1 alpha/beta hydrolase [Dactylosporangium matsuzakiense]
MVAEPHLVTRGAADPRALVVLLPGGQEYSTASARRGVAYLRMLPFGRAAADAGPGVAVWRLRYRYRGWNEPERHPVADARWALDRAAHTHPGVPVILVGHSMGGRVALRVATAPGVAGVCALAPWLEPPDHALPTDPAVPLLIAHGDRDRTTDPGESARFAAAHGGRFILVKGENHTMLRRYSRWNRLVAGFVRTVAWPNG